MPTAEMQKMERVATIGRAPIGGTLLAADLRSGVASPPAPRAWDGDDRRAPRSRREEDAAHSTVHVDIALLDKLANLVGELATVRNQILLEAAQPATRSACSQRLNLITHELQEGVMRARMQPISTVWNMLPRVIRDLATQMGKKIEIQMDGATTKLDKTILEAIKDPLTHIVRNACDHGIECPEVRMAKGKSPQGTIYLRAFQEGAQVNIEISDDGTGVDTEKIKSKAVEKRLIRAEQAAQMNDREALRLILLPGLSTAEAVTSPHTAYSAAKFAVKGFTEALISDFRLNAPHLHASVVMPGHVGTSIVFNSSLAHGRNPKELTEDQLGQVRAQMSRMGIDPSGARDEDIRQGLQQRAERFRDNAPLTAAQAATIILEGVRARRWRILVGDDAVMLDQMVRETPDDTYEPAFMDRVHARGVLTFTVD